MKEIIVKRDDDWAASIEVVENFLRLGITEFGGTINFMDFTLEEIDDLQEAISIMKDKIKRNLSNKKETIEFELPKTMSVSDFESLIGCKCKSADEKVFVVVTPTEQKDAENVSNNEQKLVYGGQIADFPIEVVEKMLDNQVLQWNPRNVSVFENRIYAEKNRGGFNFNKAPEGEVFWREVIYKKNFSLFFERYPIKMTAKHTQQENLERLMNFKIPFVRFSDKKICTIVEIDNLKSYPIKVSICQQYSYNGFFENFGNFDGSEFYVD